MQAMTGVLPGGYWDAAGVLHRDFELGVLTGREEEMLAQARRPESASLVTMVLSRCVRRLGCISPLPEDVTRQLLVADRQYLLLRLRQSTFGDVVRASVFCPWPECGKRVSLEFRIGDVPVEQAAEPAPVYCMTLSPGVSPDEDRQVTFRLPNGADQEAVSPLLAHNEAEAVSRLLARSIQQIGPFAPPGDERVAALSPAARAEIEAEMERVSPKVELSMDTTCSECGRDFAVPFELERFFFGELRTDGDLLYRQVHYLAYHYHWGEREIMDMPRDKRQTYIELLADEIERLNNRDE